MIRNLRARAARTTFPAERAECLAKADKLEAKYFPPPPPRDHIHPGDFAHQARAFDRANERMRREAQPDPRAAAATRAWVEADPEIIFEDVATASGTGTMNGTVTIDDTGQRITTVRFTWQQQ